MSEPVAKRRKTDEEAAKVQNKVEFIYKGQPKIQIPAGISHVTTSPRVKKIKDEYFLCCKTLRYVSLGKSVDSIGRAVFEGCSNLVKVDLQEGLKVIGQAAFYRCSSLVEMEVPSTVQTILCNAFKRCTSLIRVHCHKGLKSIEQEAFKGCLSLVEVILPWGLTRIGRGAFQDCTSLSAVALPLSFSLVQSASFSGCTNLVGVETPGYRYAGTGNFHMEGQIFSGCKSLVNICFPGMDAETPDDIFDGCDMLGGEDVIEGLYWRYDYLPVHKLCYYSSEVKVEELVEVFGTKGDVNLNKLEDKFGMTPFHVVATSVHPRTEILQYLMENYPHEVLERKNQAGKTMVDYLIRHTSAEAVPPLKMVLEKVILESVSKWKLGDTHKLELNRRLTAIPSDHDTKARRTRVNDFLQYLGYCARLGQTSLMELTMWKMKIAGVSVSGSETTVDRTKCFYQTGADRVVNNVVSFLWGGESTTSTALSIFPLLSEDDTRT